MRPALCADKIVVPKGGHVLEIGALLSEMIPHNRPCVKKNITGKHSYQMSYRILGAPNSADETAGQAGGGAVGPSAVLWVREPFVSRWIRVCCAKLARGAHEEEHLRMDAELNQNMSSEGILFDERSVDRSWTGAASENPMH